MASTAAKSDYLSACLLRHFLGQATFTPPAALYVALFNVDPGDDGSLGVEVSGGGYARQSVQFGAVSAQGQAVNSSHVTFPDVTVSWGSVGGFGLFDAPTEGNLLYHGALLRPDPDNLGQYMEQATTLAIGDVYMIRAGSLSVREM